MTKVNETYKCKICGNIIKVIHEGVGELYCCGLPMEIVEGKDLEKDK